MGVFSEYALERLPEGMTLPPELIETWDWLERQGWIKTLDADDYGEPAERPMLHVEPLEIANDQAATNVTFLIGDLPFSYGWSESKPEVDARIFEIAVLSGDGGRGAIWLAPDGTQRFVMSGHDALGVVSEDVKTFLAFVAMGYAEPGGLEATGITPIEQALYYYGFETAEEFSDDEPAPRAPTAFQEFLRARFDIIFPETARELGIADFEPYAEPDELEEESDPFRRWVAEVTLPPTEEELRQIEEMADMAERIARDFDKPTLLDRVKNLFRRT